MHTTSKLEQQQQQHKVDVERFEKLVAGMARTKEVGGARQPNKGRAADTDGGDRWGDFLRHKWPYILGVIALEVCRVVFLYSLATQPY
jgi:hypothetical protein